MPKVDFLNMVSDWNFGKPVCTITNTLGDSVHTVLGSLLKEYKKDEVEE